MQCFAQLWPRIAAIAAAALLMVPSGPAAAYSEPALFHRDVEGGGSSGRFFTGSPREGFGCNVCHAGGRSFEAQVSGLPEHGYLPGKNYILEFTWPEFTAVEQVAIAESGSGPPTVKGSLVLEIGSERGSIGTLELRNRTNANAEENCSTGINKTRASEMYSLRSGSEVEEALVRCVTRQADDRCIVAVRPCGAKKAILQWTAPDSFAGPVYLAAGFTTTLSASNSADGDGTFQLLRVIPEAGSPSQVYEEEVAASCSLSTMPADQRSAPLLLVGALLGVLRVRRRVRAARVHRLPRRGLHNAVLLACAVWLSGGCFASVVDDAQQVVPNPVSGRDLFDQAAETLDGGNLAEPPDEGSGLGDRCMPLPLGADGSLPRTPGTLELSFVTRDITTIPKAFDYGPSNAGAAWIEALDPADPSARESLIGYFVANLEVWTEERAQALRWYDHACRSAVVDAVTSATLDEHGPHTLTWNGRDFEGNVAPDGDYALWMEVSESQYVFSDLVKVPFTKGSDAFELKPDGTDSLRDIVLTYTPGASSSE